MLQLIRHQFTHSWKLWAGSLLLFITAGFIVGTCLNGIFTIAADYPHLSSAHNPSIIFMYPLIFGLITLFTITSGIIKLMINSLAKEYALWTILGANPNQLSQLIGGQMGIISVMGALIGFTLGVPVTVELNVWVTGLIKLNTITIPLNFSLPACLVTVLSIGLTSSLAGYFHAHKLFVGSQDDLLKFKTHRSKYQAIGHSILVSVSTLTLIFCYVQSFFISHQAQAYLDAGRPHEAAKAYVSNLMIIMLLSIFLVILLAQWALPKIIAIWTSLISKATSAHLNTAFWHTLFDQSYLASLVTPLIIGSFLLTGVNYITSEITNGGGNQAAAANAKASTVVFLGAPLLIILANVLTMTLIFQKQRSANLSQLSLLGFTARDLILERFFEVIIYAITFFVTATIANAFLYALIDHIELITHNVMRASWLTILAWPAYLLGIIIGFSLIVELWRIHNFEKYRLAS